MSECDRHGLVEERGVCPACEHPSLSVRPEYRVTGASASGEAMRSETLATLYELLRTCADGDVFVTTVDDGDRTTNALVSGGVGADPVVDEESARERIYDHVDAGSPA